MLVTFYILLTAVVAITIAIKVNVVYGLCAFGAAILAAIAGGGTREGIRKWQGITTIGIIMLGFGLFALAYWLWHKFSVVLFGYQIPGETWTIVGAVLGFFLA